MLNAKKMSVTAVAIIIFITFSLFIKSDYAVQYLINMLMFAYLATAWNIIGGYAGQMALGNGVYFGIGSYVSTVLFMYEGVTPWIGMIVGGLIAAVLAAVLGSMTFRLSGSYFSLATVALLHVIRLLFLSNTTMFGYPTKGALGLYVPWVGDSILNMQFMNKKGYLYVILLFFLIGLGVSYYIKNSKMGYYLAAINTNQEAASSVGVNVMGMKLKASCISAFMTAVGGSFYAMFIMVVDPARVLGYDLSVQIMMYAVIGGRGTLWGPVLTAFLLAPLSDILRATFGSSISGLALVIYGFILMLIVYFIPQGIWPFITKKFNTIVAAAKAKTLNKEE